MQEQLLFEQNNSFIDKALIFKDKFYKLIITNIN